MSSGRQPTRRNRNIGTAKSGHGQDNELVIPDSWHDSLVFWEKLERHAIVTKDLDGVPVTIIVEGTRSDCVHPCTVEDLIHLLRYVPAQDLDGLEVFVLRQPKRKEQILEPVWGRLAYFAEMDQFSGPAIILEAQNLSRPIEKPRSMKPEEREELARLREDGHEFRANRRAFVAQPTLESARATQLYRTLLHEIGHWVDYLEKVRRPTLESGVELGVTEDLEARYFSRPKSEREAYAHRYADRMAEQLRKDGVIPFDRRLTRESLERDELSPADFVPDSTS